MNKTFTIFDLTTKERVKIVSCNETLIENMVTAGQGYIEGDEDHDVYGINETGTGFEEYTQSEKEDIAFNKLLSIPPMLKYFVKQTDAELNAAIEEYFLGRVDAATWRVENFRVLRKMAYSDVGDRADAAVKIKRGTKTGNADLVAEGEAQLDALDDHDWAVKERFPKE